MRKREPLQDHFCFTTACVSAFLTWLVTLCLPRLPSGNGAIPRSCAVSPTRWTAWAAVSSLRVLSAGCGLRRLPGLCGQLMYVLCQRVPAVSVFTKRV